MDNIILKGKAYFAMLTRADTKYVKEGQYRVDLIPDEDSKKLIKKHGLKIKPATESIPGEHIRLKRNHLSRKGEVNGPVPIIDAKRKPTSKIIGNDSLIKASVGVYEYGDDNAVGVYLNKVQVIDYVPYVAGDNNSEFDEEDGWTDDEAGAASEEDTDFDDDDDVLE